MRLAGSHFRRLVSAAITTILIAAGSMAVGGGAARAAQNLVIQPLDADGEVTSKVFKKNEQVKLVLSDTYTLTNEGGSYLYKYDAFYCYEGCSGTTVHTDLFAGVDAGPYDSILNLIPGSAPEYSPSHQYTVSLYNTAVSREGRLRFYNRVTKGVVDQKFSGGWTVEVLGEEEKPQGCKAIDGRVTDRESRPVRDAHVRLESAGATVDEGGTGSDGNYHLAVPPDAGTDLRVVLLAEEWGHSPSRFRLMFGTEVVGAASPIDPTSGLCTRDFAMAALAQGITTIPSPTVDLPAAFDAYQSLEAAWVLATRLEPEFGRGLPLQVFLRCERSSPPSGVKCPDPFPAHFTAIAGERPYIAVGQSSSSSEPDPMANMLGHEFGHFFMWSSFGNFPHWPGSTPHGGYYVNSSSADGWVEGFASFYSLMVRRQISGEPEATVVGSAGDMEWDSAAWADGGKWEEFAVVGILLDLADGPGESRGGGDRPVSAAVYISDKRDLFAAQVPPDTEVGTPWRAELLTSSGRRLRTIRGAVVVWEGVRIALGKLPDIPFASIRLVLRPYGRTDDDDPIKGDLFTLWPAILNFRSENAASASAGNHLFDVQDLYRAARLLYGSDRDGNQNGVPDVDEVFTAHGFFGDTKGGVSNRKLDPGEIPGLSSHTEMDVGSTKFPAMVPRSSPPLLPELQAKVDTGGTEATALVQVEFPDPNGDASFAALVTPDAQGLVPLPVPPPGSGGTVSVIMLAKGRRPAPALEVDSETFWSEADRNLGRSFLSASVSLEPGTVLSGNEVGTTAGEGGGFQLWPVLVLLFIALGVAIAVYSYSREQRSTRSPPG